jgi:hypothetical protein
VRGIVGHSSRDIFGEGRADGSQLAPRDDAVWTLIRMADTVALVVEKGMRSQHLLHEEPGRLVDPEPRRIRTAELPPNGFALARPGAPAR